MSMHDEPHPTLRVPPRSSLAGRLAWVSLVLWSVHAAGLAEAAESCRVFPARMVAESVGVNTHMQQGWQYDDRSETLSALRALGVDSLREAFTGLGHPGIEAAARAGFKFDFVINAGWGLGVTDALVDWVHRYPGSIAAIEGPNEVNNWPVSYAGRSGIPAAMAFQNDLYARVHGEPALAGVPVLALTSWPVFRNRSDLGNVHAYARSGAFASEDVRKAIADEHNLNPPVKAVWLTEVGYHTGIGLGRDEGVSEMAQAKMTLAILLSSLQLGVEKTFIYQLEDQYTNTADEQSHFGLVDVNWRRKPAFTAVANLLTILKSKAGVMDHHDLSFALAGMPPGAHRMMIEQEGGGIMLALWDEAPIWDARSHAPIPSSDRTVALVADHELEHVEVFDPMRGSGPVRTIEHTKRIELTLNDHPTLIALGATANDGNCGREEVP